MKDWKIDQKKRILESAQKLQTMPIFKPYKVNGIRIDWNNGIKKKYISTVSIKSQERTYKIRWLAEALYCCMDSPKQTFPKHLEWMKKEFGNDKKVMEALQTISPIVEEGR